MTKRSDNPTVCKPVIEDAVDVPIRIFHAIANLWLAIELLSEADEAIEANHVHLPMERLCLKYQLPLAEAEAWADRRKFN
jgi:uncharacterized SAM-dependent methyltransferase